MTDTAPRTNRLYDLLPVIHRLRDIEQGQPLEALLAIIAEHVQAIEDDIKRQYDNWFIETAEDWVVPYIGDLVDWSPVAPGGEDGGSARAAARVLSPRADVANTIAFRRRRGTLSVQEDLAAAVGRWPGRSVEFFRLLSWAQSLAYPEIASEGHRTVSLRSAARLELVGSAFDPFAHTADIRRVNSRRTQGRHNIPSVGHFLWRLGSWPVTRAPAFCVDASSNCYSFSALGNDAPLFHPQPDHIGAGCITRGADAPSPIRRRALADTLSAPDARAHLPAIWTDWDGCSPDAPLPPDRLIVADLSDWHYAPPRGRIAIDPVLGRFRFPTDQLPRRQVSVSYNYGFAAAMGSGEYPRHLETPAGAKLYTVGEGGDFRKIGAALEQWAKDAPETAIIELTDNRAYVEPIDIKLAASHSLELRAASGKRPLIRLLDWQLDAPDALTATLGEAASLTLDGLLIAGRGLVVFGETERETRSACGAWLTVRHCTLVPGWSIEADCCPVSPAKHSIELRNVRAHVSIEHSITGPISVLEDEVHAEPIALSISDSIVDAMSGTLGAISAPEGRHAHVMLSVRRSTVFGIVEVHAMPLGEDSVFMDCVHVARRQIGCMRYCHVPSQCRTPRRFHCQPDLAGAGEAEHVRPRFTARHYGEPGYGQLSLDCTAEIAAGASDGAEMGAFHDLYQPQRLANIQTRLDEYTPAGMDAGIVICS